MPDENDKAAVAMAASMGPALAACVDREDAEGIAARESVTAFAAAIAELDALIVDSDDEQSAEAAPKDLVAEHLRRLEQETAWQDGPVGLEVQRPWSQMILTGTKSVETRTYPLPATLVGRAIYVLETEENLAGTSCLADRVDAGDPSVQLVGTVTFGSCVAYASKDEWLADEARHCVPPDSSYGWSRERIIYGWRVASFTRHERPHPCPMLERRQRSLFEMDCLSDLGENSDDVLQPLEKRMRCDLVLSQ